MIQILWKRKKKKMTRINFHSTLKMTWQQINKLTLNNFRWDIFPFFGGSNFLFNREFQLTTTVLKAPKWAEKRIEYKIIENWKPIKETMKQLAIPVMSACKWLDCHMRLWALYSMMNWWDMFQTKCSGQQNKIQTSCLYQDFKHKALILMTLTLVLIWLICFLFKHKFTKSYWIISCTMQCIASWGTAKPSSHMPSLAWIALT